MKVLSTIASISSENGGTSKVFCALSNVMSDKSISQHLLFSKIKKEELTELEHKKNVKLWFFDGIKNRWLNIYRHPNLTKMVHGICQNEKIDLIHNHGVWLPVNHVATKVARELKIPLVVTTHGMLTLWHFRHKAWKKRPAWWLYQKKDLESASIVHVTAQNEADDLRAIGYRKTLAIIPNGIEVPEWREPSGQREIRTALFLSRLHPKKGLLNLVEAWSLVRPKGWQMLIVGPDDEGHGKAVRKAVMEKGLQKEFVFQGPVYGEDRLDLYRNADLFILPTFSENFGIVVPEALACGLPVITTHGAPWAELNSRCCGWWFPIGVEPLTRVLREATEKSDYERKQMGVLGRRLVEEKYTWDSVGRQMKSLYEWILGGGTAPPFVQAE